LLPEKYSFTSFERLPDAEVTQIFNDLHEAVTLERGGVVTGGIDPALIRQDYVPQPAPQPARMSRQDAPVVQPGRRITQPATPRVQVTPVQGGPTATAVSINTSATTHNIAGVNAYTSSGPTPMSAPWGDTPAPVSAPRDTPAPVSAPRDTPAPVSAPRDTPAPVSAPRDTPAPAGPTPVTMPRDTPGPVTPPVDVPAPGSAPTPATMQRDIPAPVAPQGGTPVGRGRGTSASRGRGTPRGRGPSRTSQAISGAKNVINKAGTKINSALQRAGAKTARGLQELRMSAETNLTPQGLKTATKEMLGLTNIGSVVAGYFAFTGTKNLIETNWQDKSEGAKFITDLTAAEVSNLSSTLVMYTGKPIVGAGISTLRGTYTAAKAFASAGRSAAGVTRSVAALRSVTGSMASSQAAMRAAFSTERALATVGEAGVNLAKSGAAVFVSLAFETASLEAMKAAGVTSHVWLEGNSAAAGATAGLAVLLATEALTGPVGWAMLGVTLAGVIYSYAHGKMLDDWEKDQKHKHDLFLAQQMLTAEKQGNYMNVYKQLVIKHLLESDGDLEKAKFLAARDPEFTKFGYGAFSVVDTMIDQDELNAIMRDHFTDEGILELTKPSLGTGAPTTDPDSARINDIYRRAFTYKYALESGVKPGDLPPNISDEDRAFMNQKTNNTFESSINLEVTLQIETNKYTTERVTAAHQEAFRLWNDEGKLIDEADPLMQELAYIDPDFYDYYHTNVTLDAQAQIFRAFNEGNMLIDDLPDSLVGVALQDPDFLPLYRNYTRKMVELSDHYNMSVQELLAQQDMTQEQIDHLNDNLRAEFQAEVDKVKAANQVIVDKYNADLAAQISAYGANLPDIIRNISDQLRLSGSGRVLLGNTANDLYAFLKMEAPEVTFTIPEPVPELPFEFDPSKLIDTKPISTYELNPLLRQYQDAEIAARIDYLEKNGGATPEDRARITNAVRSGDSSKMYSEKEDERDILKAKTFGMTLEKYRSIIESHVKFSRDDNFTPEQLTMIKQIQDERQAIVTNENDMKLLKSYQDAEVEARMAMTPNATEEDRERIRLAIETGNGELLYSIDDDERDTKIAQIWGIPLANYRESRERELRKKVDTKFKPEELKTINRKKSETIIQTQGLSDSQIMDKYKQELDWQLSINNASSTPMSEDELKRRFIIEYRNKEKARALAAAKNPVVEPLEKPGEYTDEQLIQMLPDRYMELREKFEREAIEDNDPIDDEDFLIELVAQYLRREQRQIEQAAIDARTSAPVVSEKPKEYTDDQLIQMLPDRYLELRAELERQAAEDNFPMEEDMYREHVARQLRTEQRQKEQAAIDARANAPAPAPGPPVRLTEKQINSDPKLKSQVTALLNSGMSMADAYEKIKDREFNKAKIAYEGANAGNIYEKPDDQTEIDAINARKDAEAKARKDAEANQPVDPGGLPQITTPTDKAPPPAPANKQFTPGPAPAPAPAPAPTT